MPYSQSGASSSALAITMISTRCMLRRKARPNGVIPSSKHYVVADPTNSAVSLFVLTALFLCVRIFPLSIVCYGGSPERLVPVMGKRCMR